MNYTMLDSIPNPCSLCHSRVHINSGLGYHLEGSLIFFRSGLKKYVKGCCFYAYHVGSKNFIDYDNRKQMHSVIQVLDLMKCPNPKFAYSEHGWFEVYELREKRTDRHVNRNVLLKECWWPYEIIGKTEHSKRNERITAKPIPVSDSSISSSDDVQDTVQYVYLLRDRTAVQANQNIYKIGKTTQPNFDRFKGYPKGYEMLLHIACEDCHQVELNIISLFKIKYTHITDYGNEYFAGDWKSMMRDITLLAQSS